MDIRAVLRNRLFLLKAPSPKIPLPKLSALPLKKVPAAFSGLFFFPNTFKIWARQKIFTASKRFFAKKRVGETQILLDPILGYV